ncbi:MAG TPA: hypothetical protein VGL10_06700 [Gammaproteobacteria bacterium]
MKKSIIIGMLCGLISLPLSFSTAAKGFDTDRWDAYCKVQKNKERCVSAYNVCEQYGKADCDQIKLAFMEYRSLDPILAKSKTTEKPKTSDK